MCSRGDLTLNFLKNDIGLAEKYRPAHCNKNSATMSKSYRTTIFMQVVKLISGYSDPLRKRCELYFRDVAAQTLFLMWMTMLALEGSDLRIDNTNPEIRIFYERNPN